MAQSNDRSPRLQAWQGLWPWLVLALIAGVAAWHYRSPDDHRALEFRASFALPSSPIRPRVSTRRTWRYARPDRHLRLVAGDRDRSLGHRSATHGDSVAPGSRLLSAVSMTAFWLVSTPWPTFDGWHGCAWQSMLDAETPVLLRLALGLGAMLLAGVSIWGIWPRPKKHGRAPMERRSGSRDRRIAGRGERIDGAQAF